MTFNQYRRARNLLGLRIVAAEQNLEPIEAQWRREWDAAPSPFIAWQQWVSPEKKAERAHHRAELLAVTAELADLISRKPRRPNALSN